MPPAPAPTPPPPGGSHPPGRQGGGQELIFRLVNASGVGLQRAELELVRQPGRSIPIPLRDDGLDPRDQPADAVYVGVSTGPYARLAQGRLMVDSGNGPQLVWEGVLSLPDRDSDGAAWTLQVQQGQLAARPVAALPAGDSVAGLVGGYPLAGATFWGVFLLTYVGVLVALRVRGGAAS